MPTHISAENETEKLLKIKEKQKFLEEPEKNNAFHTRKRFKFL